MPTTMQEKNNLAQLVPRGGMGKIAAKLGITSQAVSLALKAAKPNHPAVLEALKMAEECGTLAAAQTIAGLARTPAPAR